MALSQSSAPIVALAASLAAFGASPAHADAVADFYAGKSINLTVAYPPGGGYDVYSRILARHLPKYIPGNPKIIIQNMPGAGGIKAANFMYSIAPHDGLALGMISDNAASEEVIGTPGITFVSKNFGWIGRIMMSLNVTMVLPGAPVQTMAQLKEREIIMGGTSAAGFTTVLHNVANAVGGTRFKSVNGYVASPETCLAMERGEVQGCTPSWTFVKTARRQWLDPRNATVVMQWGMARHPELPDTPTMTELGTTAQDKKILALFASASDIGRALVVPPGTPADRVNALREAFMQAANDPDLVAETKTGNLDRDPLSGDELQRLVTELSDVTPEFVARAKKAHDAE